MTRYVSILIVMSLSFMEGILSNSRASRMTVQRRMILEEVRAARSHPTADDVYDRVRKRLPRISLGTVYRNLEALATQGVIQRLDLSGGQRRFDHEPVPHYHVRCVECGSLADVSLKPSMDPGDVLEEGCEFEILAVRLEFLGICPQCRRVKKDSHD